MAVDLTLKSVQITNRDATPAVANNPGAGAAGIVRTVRGHLASVTNALSITSVIRLCEIPSNAIVESVKIYAAAQGAGAFDIGVYRNTKDGGAVVDQDYFASAVDCASAVLGTDVTQEAGSPATNTIAKMNQPLWQALGASADPTTTYDIAATVAGTDVTTGAAALGIKVNYTL